MRSRGSRRALFGLAALLLAPPGARAQANRPFVEATVRFLQAADGEFGDEGPYLLAALDAMAGGLTGWDAALGRAEAGLRAEIGKAPPRAAARMRAALAAAYTERGRFDDALAQLETATALEPSFADGQLLKGFVLERLGRADAARDAYLSAWRASNLASAYWVATHPSQAAAGGTDVSAALNDLLAAVVRQPGSTDVRLLFPTDAFLDDRAAKSPVLPLARYAPAFALIREAKFDQALATLRAAVASDPLVTAATASPELRAAAGALRAGDAPGAVERLTAVVEAQPGSGQAHRVLGLAHRAAGSAEQALRQLSEAIRLDPADERARLAQADLLSQMGLAADARQALRATVQRLPQSGQACGRLGQLALDDGDWGDAVAWFERAAALHPLAGSSALQATLGRIYTQQADLDGAIRAYAALAAVLPHDRAAHSDLGGAYRAAGNTEAALVEYLAAALLDPSNANAVAAAGQVLASQERDADAVTVLQRAVALDPKQREARYALGRALMRLGRPEEAAEQLRVFEQLQTAAMDEQRRRFENNAETIEQLLQRPVDGTTGR